MSEVLKKHKDRIKYLQQLGKAYQDLIGSTLVYLKSYVTGAEDLEKALDSLGKRVKTAENIFQVEQIRKDYLSLGKKISAHMKKTGKAPPKETGGLLSSLGSLFGGSGGSPEEAVKAIKESRERGENIELVDAVDDLLHPYVSLLDGFAKGTLILADEEEPFYTSLRGQRGKKFSALAQKPVDTMLPQLNTFFFNKSNEAATVETEREELKKIIGSMTGYIKSVAVSSETFGSKLDAYSKKVSSATDLSEIKLIQKAILNETMEIKKANTSMVTRLSETESELEGANEKIMRLENDLKMARQEKSVDALTQIYNRGFFDQAIVKVLENYKRYKDPGSLILFDIDHFKKFNDTFGHQAGDQVLRVVARITKESVRSSDIVARYGGEEFVVILNKAELDKAVKVAENIRKNIGEHELGLGGKTVNVTVSLGVAEFRMDDKPGVLVERTDKRLYAAKEKGRNCVVYQ